MSEGKERFDVMVHLAGEQAIPNLLAMRQFDAGLHVMVVSERTRGMGKNLKNCGERVGAEVLVADPWDIDAIGRTLSEANFPQGSLAFNVTGGTKIMSLAALRVAEKKGCDAFYVDTTNRRLLNLTGRGVFGELKPALKIEDFMAACGHGIAHKGEWGAVQASRAATTRGLWKNRLALQRNQETIALKAKRRGEFEFETKGVKAGFRNGKGHLAIRSVEVPEAAEWKDFHVYLSGGWFEEYVYLLLEPLLAQGLLSDLRVNLAPAWGAAPRKQDLSGIQELDVVATDGLRLVIIECKAGRVQQAHCQKIENIVKHFAGALATGVMAVAGRQSQPIAERLRKADNFATFSGNSVERRLAEKILDLHPGRVFGDLEHNHSRNLPNPGARKRAKQ